MHSGALTLVLLAVVAAVCASSLSYQAQSTGDYEILVNGKTWLSGGWTGFHSNNKWYSSADKSLVLKNQAKHTGSDKLGSFEATSFTWQGGDTTFVTTLRAYAALNAVAFVQYFPNGVSNTSVSSRDDVVSVFPSFKVPTTDEIAFSGLKGSFLQGEYYGQFKQGLQLPDGLDGSGPLILFEQTLQSVTVFSSFSNFMSWSYTVTDNVVTSGVMGTVTDIPAGFTQESIIVLDSGINKAVRYWGSLLLKQHDKVPRHDTYALNYLGYNTDHGAYYYYHTESGKNYEDTLIEYYQYSVKEKIPHKWILLDSWWYFKGIGGGVKNWTVRPDVFPNGMRHFRDVTSWPIMGHNRYWASDTVYAKQNGGDFNFVVDPPKAIPLDRGFWDYLLKSSADWGLMVYEQDWLYNEFEGLNVTLKDPTMARKWLLEMGFAAEANKLTIQYCMPWPKHVLQSVEIPAVTHVRATDDHLPGNSKWKMGFTSMVIHALGLSPFKDNFWTTEDQPNNPYGKSTEPYTRFESCIATFSCGPVTPADKIGYANRTLVMKSCMDDGKLLQPSKPLTMIDATFVKRAFGNADGPDGELWSTFTHIGEFRFDHVLGVTMASPFKVGPTEIGNEVAQNNSYIAFSNPEMSNGNPAMFGPSNPIIVSQCTEANFNLWHTAPVFANNWAIMGEVSKWVPISNDRITGITYDESSLQVSIRGVPNEAVTFAFASVEQNKITEHSLTCTVPESGSASFTISGSTLSCTLG